MPLVARSMPNRKLLLSGGDMTKNVFSSPPAPFLAMANLQRSA
jgi:hypothetical protein